MLQGIIRFGKAFYDQLLVYIFASNFVKLIDLIKADIDFKGSI